MWRTLLLSILTVWLPRDHNGGKHLKEFVSDAPTVLNPNFVPTPYGPQTAEEEALLRQSLNGRHFGGDQVLPKDWNSSNVSNANVINTGYRWYGYPGKADVPFVFHQSIQHRSNSIINAIKKCFTGTCITFYPRTNQRNYLVFYQGDGCKSEIGMVGGQQGVSYDRNCDSVGIMCHEIFHALGFIHEHQRPDRDKYIWVYKQNAQPSAMENFGLADPNFVQYRNIEYYYGSIMHYGNYAFTKNGQKTMEAKDGTPLIEPYDRPGLSTTDYDWLRNLYKC